MKTVRVTQKPGYAQFEFLKNKHDKMPVNMQA